jgi:hypothetical protein
MVSRISQSTNRPATVVEIRLEQQKTEKILLDFDDGRRKGSTISERTDNPDTGAGITCRLSNRRRHDMVSEGSCPMVEKLFGPVSCHEQTTHVGARRKKKAVAPEVA